MIFKDGQRLSWIEVGDGTTVTVGKNDVEVITVSMENGQMAAVPWARVEIKMKETVLSPVGPPREKETVEIRMVNLANVVAVGLAKP